MINSSGLFYLFQKSLILLLLLSAVPVLTALITGLLVSFFQSVTQIQESTLSYVPKFLAVSFALIMTGPMIASELMGFQRLLMLYIANLK